MVNYSEGFGYYSLLSYYPQSYAYKFSLNVYEWIVICDDRLSTITNVCLILHKKQHREQPLKERTSAVSLEIVCI